MSLFLLGLDGGRLLTVEKLVKKGKLPVFEEILKSSLASHLDSTIPPITVPAWGTIFSGKNPGELGCVDFIRPGKDYKPVLNAYAKTKWVWDYLCERNIPCAIFRAISIKPYRIRLGFFTDFEKCYPRNPRLIFKRKDISPEMSHEERIEITVKNFQKESEIVLRFMKKNMPHKFVVFSTAMIDAVSHLTHEEKKIEEAYELIDSFLEKLLPILRKRKFSLVIVSDHGIKKVEKRVNVNRALEKIGMLKLQKDIFTDIKIEIAEFFETHRRIKNLFLKISKTSRKIKEAHNTFILGFDSIDFSSTKLFGFGTCTPSEYALIWVNDERFKSGEKNKITKTEFEHMLKENFSEVVIKVFEKYEIWKGKNLTSLPDFVIKLKENCTVDYRLFKNVEMKYNDFIHSKDGLFLFANFSSSEYKKIPMRAEDVTPFILSHFGLR